MAFPCPQCGDRYTQSLPMVYGTSTSTRSWRSRSGYSGTTVSQTLVGQIAAPPAKRSVLWPLVWLLVLSGVLVVLQQFVRDQSLPHTQARVPPVGHRTQVRRHGGTLPVPEAGHETALPVPQWDRVAEILGIMWWVAGLAVTGFVVRAIWFNWRVYPVEFDCWSHSYMCRGCGMVFPEPVRTLAGQP